jgi:methyl-accepting chemotaxis protein
LLRETAPIIDGLAKKAIEKSERGSTSLTEDVYQIGRQSTSLSSSIAGFLNEMSRGDDSLENSIGRLNADVAQLGEVGGLYSRANESLNTSITRVSQSVGETSELIGKVSDIAEQTSILAINAAIYAAKAGEFGRGFSVIAGEIQKLAATSKEVAETIGSNTLTIERQVGEFSNTHRSLIADSRESLSETIASIQRTIVGLAPKVERVAASIQTAAGTSRSVTNHLNEINMAMQEQDAIQQIVAHIADILRESLERVPATDRVTTGVDGRNLRELARQLAARHFTMKDEYAAVGDDGYGAVAPATAVLEDGTELRGDVTLF